MRKTKKGSIEDLVFIMVVIVVISILALIMFKISDSFNDKITTLSMNNTKYFPQEAIAVNTQVNDEFSTVIDGSILFVLFGLSIVSIALAAMVRVHPVFFIFYLIIFTAIIFISAAYANIYIKMANMPDFIDVANRLSITGHIIQWLPYFIGALGFILAAIQYKNWQEAT